VIRVLHPRPQAGRQRFIGIEFRDGFSTVESLHPEVEAALLQHGFTIEKELVSDGDHGPFESLPAADGTEKVSKRRKRETPPPDPEDPPPPYIVPLGPEED
jgi:hypothetical protein